MVLHHIWSDNSGVSPIVEYIITFVLASFVFSVMLMLSNSMFIEGPQKSVSELQYTDIGNDMTAKVIDTYLIAPKQGNISTVFEMPASVGGNGYSVYVRPSKNGWDKEIAVSSLSGDVIMSVTLDGVNSTIPINASARASSQSTLHKIWYDSR